MISRGIGKSAARSVARSLSQFGSGGVAPSYDTDAQTYITAVEAADSQSLETGVKDAINAFVVGCKSDGIWTAIKASCILAGARTLSGALVPLVGTAPTNNNFVSGDYNRTAGLTGDGSTKYLDSNRASNSDPQNNAHHSVYLTAAGTSGVTRTSIGSQFTTSSADFNAIYTSSSLNSMVFTSRNGFGNTGVNVINGAGDSIGFIGVQRQLGTEFSFRMNSTAYLANTGTCAVSYTPSSATYAVFARNQSPPSLYTDATLAFYSIGESLDLADLDARVTTLITDIGTALA